MGYLLDLDMLLEMMMINKPNSTHDAPDKSAAIRGVFNWYDAVVQ